MLTDSLQNLLERDLNKLKAEINAYQNEQNLWKVDRNISNSGGNLCLHLIGNLKTYIGFTLGNIHYVRDRPLEFSNANVPRAELIEAIEETQIILKKTLSGLTESQLLDDYPVDPGKEESTTFQYLIHLSLHLAYHLGQINYHRRFLDI
ncbi:Protein of unknown function DUF1572 [Flavobacteriaceae bacterium]|jgi:hypothetical protein